MKKVLAVMIALVLLMANAFADCACMTDEVRVAIFDMLEIGNISIAQDEHDTLVEAYLGIDASCANVKPVLMRVVCRNYVLITESMDLEKFACLTEYIVSCCCGEADPASTDTPEETPIAVPTEVPEVTPAPTVKHTHTGGTHENGGVCSVCGKVYQRHVWSSWKGTTNNVPHERVCTCGVKETGKHSFKIVEERYSYILKECSVCGLQYKASKNDNSSCSCGSCCSGCGCGCGK